MCGQLHPALAPAAANCTPAVRTGRRRAFAALRAWKNALQDPRLGRALVDDAGDAAYHRPHFGEYPHVARHEPYRQRNLELRLPNKLILAVAVLLTACATPAPAPVEPAPPPPEVVAVAPEIPPPPLPEPPPPPKEPELFPAAAGADLEPLPPPVGDLWERIVAGYAIPDLDGPLVEKWEQWYASRPEYMARMVERSRRYLYHIVTEVTARHVPTEIALLPMIESAYNPIAMSTSRASGIWQFIPSTGKHYGLTQDFWIDSRRDVLAATDKALDLPDQAARRFRRLAIGARRIQLGRRQRRRRRSRATRRRVSAPTTRASRCPPRPATICRNCRR